MCVKLFLPAPDASYLSYQGILCCMSGSITTMLHCGLQLVDCTHTPQCSY